MAEVVNLRKDYQGNAQAYEYDGLTVRELTIEEPIVGLGLFTAQVTLTAAQIKALAGTPIVVAADPGAGKVLSFLGATLRLVAGTNVLTENADNLAIKYKGGTGLQVSETIECTGFIDQSADTIINVVPIKDAKQTVANMASEALYLVNLNDEFAGNAANDAELVVTTTYRVDIIA